jgi:two-component system, NarL family, response regulator
VDTRDTGQQSEREQHRITRPLIAEGEQLLEHYQQYAARQEGRRVLLVDHQPALCEGLRSLLEGRAHLFVLGIVHDADSAVSFLRKFPTDLIVLDLDLPGEDPPSLVARLRAHAPAARIAVLSHERDVASLRSLLPLGVTGYILKSEPLHHLLEALLDVLGGECSIDPELAQRALVATIPQLTRREKEVLDLIARGESNKAIAETLGVKRQTVEFHAHRIFEKLGVTSRTRAVACASQLGLLRRSRHDTIT